MPERTFHRLRKVHPSKHRSLRWRCEPIGFLNPELCQDLPNAGFGQLELLGEHVLCHAFRVEFPDGQITLDTRSASGFHGSAPS